jgi:hypothetical protein
MRRLAQLLAATLLGVAAVAVIPVGSASAAACSRGTGVSVVVGNDVRCDAGGAGQSSDQNFTGVGHSLTYVSSEPGFVCQVDSAPSSDCVKTPSQSAYWALWWSDGTSGSWTYSSRGVKSLKVPAGGYVALVFGNGKSAPGVKPVSAAPAPTKKPAPAPTRTSAAASARPTPSASPSTVAEKKADEKKADDTKKATAKAERTAAAATETPTPAEPTANEADIENASESSQSAGTLWAGGAIALALLAGMGGLWWRRTLSGGAS